jgi:transposase
MDALAAGHDAAVQMIDTSIIRVHRHGACIADNNYQDMGRSRGGLTSKIHAVVDTNGLPVHLALTPGEAHDNRLCSVLLSALRPQTMLLADRGYDADWIRELARQQGAWANIPPKRNRKDPIFFNTNGRWPSPLPQSWPGLSRPSTSLTRHGFQDVDARHKAGQDESKIIFVGIIRICIARATWWSASSTGSSNVGVSRPDMTNSRPTIWRSSNSHQSEFGCALMSPRPKTPAFLRILNRAGAPRGAAE